MRQEYATIIAATLTGILGPVLMWLIRDRNTRRELHPLTGDLAAIAGVWRGSLTNEHPNPLVASSDVRMEFSGDRLVEGKGEVVGPGGRVIALTLSGGVRHSRYLMLTYAGADPAMMQFGTALLKLSATGRDLEGRFLGYGAIHDSTVYGRLALKRGSEG